MEKEVAVFEINSGPANDEINYMGGRVIDDLGNNVLIVLFPLESDVQNAKHFTTAIPDNLPDDTMDRLNDWRTLQSGAES